MLEEFKAAPVIKDHIVTFERPLHSKHSTVIALRNRLEVEGVSSSGGCVVTSENVCAWLRVLSTIQTNLRNSLPEASKVPPYPRGTSNICGELVLLDVFLRSSFFEALGKPGVERRLWRAYKTGQDTQRQKWRKWSPKSYTRPHQLIGVLQAICRVCSTAPRRVFSC